MTTARATPCGSTRSSSWRKLTPNDESGSGAFGTSVALSSDANTALIGGPSDNGRAGAAWVFTRSGSTWTQQGSKLTPNDESGTGEFGNSVALSSNGNTALIGGPSDDNGAGAAWVFTRSGSTWTQQGSKLTPNDESSPAGVGISVALSSEGEYGADWRLRRRQRCGGGVGVHPLWVHLDPAGSKLTANDESGEWTALGFAETGFVGFLFTFRWSSVTLLSAETSR